MAEQDNSLTMARGNGNLSPYGEKSQQFMRAVNASENAAHRGAFKEAFKQQGEAMRAVAALIAILTHTLDISVKEIKEQAEKILDLEGRLGNVGKGLEILELKASLPDVSLESFESAENWGNKALAERYINTKEEE